MKTIAATNDLTSIGVLCGRYQCTMRDIEKAVERAKMTPAMRINGVVHFDAEQEGKIREQLGPRAEVRSRKR